MSLSSSRGIWQPGLQLDRYELVCPIEQGGMAAVWAARLRGKRGFEKLVAVKVVLPAHAADPRFQEMFLDEARLASNIEHPNVVQTLDLGELGDSLYLVMEWVNGYSLQALLREVHRNGATVPFGVALRVVADACAGLHAAHELRNEHGAPLGVVHRDVSPHNILVSMRGAAKVIDFGIAKARDRSAGAATSTGELKGKANFMAAEQVLGKELDRRTDVWALGAVLYCLVAGHTPYREASQFATLQAIVSNAPYAPLPPSTPPAVGALVQRAMAHEPGGRFETAEAMLLAIEAAMADLKLSAGPAQVAAFVNEHLGELARQRRERIKMALVELDRATDGLEPSSDVLAGVPSSLQWGSRSHGTRPAPPASARAAAAALHAPTMVSQTGSSKVDVSVVLPPRGPGARRRHAFAVAGGLALAAAGAAAAWRAQPPAAPAAATALERAPFAREPASAPASAAAPHAPIASAAAIDPPPAASEPQPDPHEPSAAGPRPTAAPAGRAGARARPPATASPAATASATGAPPASTAPAAPGDGPATGARRKYRRDY